MAQPSEYGYKYVPPYSQPVNAQTVYGTDETPMYRPKPIKPVTERLIEKRPAGGYQTIPDYMADVYRFAREAAVEEGLDPSTPEAQAKINETVTMARQHATDFVHPVNPKEFVKVSPGEKLIHPVSGKEIASGGEKIPDSINTRNIEEGMGWQQANQMTTEAVDALGIPRESPEWVNRYHEMYRGNVDAAVPSMRDAAKAKKAQTEKMDAPKNLQQTSLLDEDGDPVVFDPSSNSYLKGGTGRPVQGKLTVDQSTVTGKLTPRPKELPTAAQDDLNQSIQGLKALEDMEKNIDVSGEGPLGRAKGVASQVGYALGTDQRAIDFATAGNRMKLSAQATIKGIPSNFDVETMIATLPVMTQSKSVNKARIKDTKDQFKSLVENTISYYKKVNRIIPESVVAQASHFGINVDSIKPWDGKGDPLARGKLSSVASGSSSSRIATKQEFDALPSGATYIGKDGKTYRKP